MCVCVCVCVCVRGVSARIHGVTRAGKKNHGKLALTVTGHVNKKDF